MATGLLDEALIRAQLRPLHAARLQGLELLADVDSTNSRLLSGAPPPPGMLNACIAERQHAGRGRRGRTWVAPPGAAVTMSVGSLLDSGGRDLPALCLAAGVAVVRAVERCGAAGVALKWPNDIWFEDRKVGGILVEARSGASGPAFVVIGIGINVFLDRDQRAELLAGGVLAAALADACAAPVARVAVAGAILDEVSGMLSQFEQDGFAPFLASWTGLDALRGRQSRVVLGDTAVVGCACGVDGGGALLVEVGGQVQRFNSGEVSLRPHGDAA